MSNINQEPIKSQHRYVGIDYLRAFFSLCVILVHLGYIYPSNIFDKTLYLKHVFTVSDFLNFYVLLLAVPIFYIISNFLFYHKEKNIHNLYEYCKRIGKIVFFWIAAFNIFAYAGWNILGIFPKDLWNIFIFIINGAGTLYYFFISLILLTIITHFSKKINTIYILIFFIFTTFLIACFPIIAIFNVKYINLCVFWNPLNFIAYPFAAILVYKLIELDKNKKIKLKYFFIFGIIILLSIIADWTIYLNKIFFIVNGYPIPAYTRPSLIFISMFVLFLFIKLEPNKNSIILFMSKNSLLLYCLHPFFMGLVTNLSQENIFKGLLLTIIFCYSTGMIISPFINKELLR